MVGVVSGSLYRRTQREVVWLGLWSAAAWRHSSSVTSVVRATREVNGRRQTYPSHHTHTP